MMSFLQDLLRKIITTCTVAKQKYDFKQLNQKVDAGRSSSDASQSSSERLSEAMLDNLTRAFGIIYYRTDLPILYNLAKRFPDKYQQLFARCTGVLNRQHYEWGLLPHYWITRWVHFTDDSGSLVKGKHKGMLNIQEDKTHAKIKNKFIKHQMDVGLAAKLQAQLDEPKAQTVMAHNKIFEFIFFGKNKESYLQLLPLVDIHTQKVKVHKKSNSFVMPSLGNLKSKIINKLFKPKKSDNINLNCVLLVRSYLKAYNSIYPAIKFATNKPKYRNKFFRWDDSKLDPAKLRNFEVLKFPAGVKYRIFNIVARRNKLSPKYRFIRFYKKALEHYNAELDKDLPYIVRFMPWENDHINKRFTDSILINEKIFDKLISNQAPLDLDARLKGLVNKFESDLVLIRSNQLKREFEDKIKGQKQVADSQFADFQKKAPAQFIVKTKWFGHFNLPKIVRKNILSQQTLGFESPFNVSLKSSKERNYTGPELIKLYLLLLKDIILGSIHTFLINAIPNTYRDLMTPLERKGGGRKDTNRSKRSKRSNEESLKSQKKQAEEAESLKSQEEQAEEAESLKSQEEQAEEDVSFKSPYERNYTGPELIKLYIVRLLTSLLNESLFAGLPLMASKSQKKQAEEVEEVEDLEERDKMANYHDDGLEGLHSIDEETGLTEIELLQKSVQRSKDSEDSILNLESVRHALEGQPITESDRKVIDKYLAKDRRTFIQKLEDYYLADAKFYQSFRRSVHYRDFVRESQKNEYKLDERKNMFFLQSLLYKYKNKRFTSTVNEIKHQVEFIKRNSILNEIKSNLNIFKPFKEGVHYSDDEFYKNGRRNFEAARKSLLANRQSIEWEHLRLYSDLGKAKIKEYILKAPFSDPDVNRLKKDIDNISILYPPMREYIENLQVKIAGYGKIGRGLKWIFNINGILPYKYEVFGKTIDQIQDYFEKQIEREERPFKPVQVNPTQIYTRQNRSRLLYDYIRYLEANFELKKIQNLDMHRLFENAFIKYKLFSRFNDSSTLVIDKSNKHLTLN